MLIYWQQTKQNGWFLYQISQKKNYCENRLLQKILLRSRVVVEMVVVAL